MGKLGRHLVLVGVVSSILGVSLLLAASSGRTVGQTAGAVAAKGSLESLLKECKMDYTRTSDGDLKIMVSDGEDSALVYAREVALGAKGDDKLAYFYCLVVDVPDGFKHPIAMLKKMAEINDSLLEVSLDLSPPPETSGIAPHCG